MLQSSEMLLRCLPERRANPAEPERAQVEGSRECFLCHAASGSSLANILEACFPAAREEDEEEFRNSLVALKARIKRKSDRESCYSGQKNAERGKAFVSRIIPTPVIAVAAQVLETHFTHTQIDILMESLGIIGPPPSGNKVEKLRGWLRNANADPDPRSDALGTLGKVLEEFMEVDPPYGPHQTQIDGRKKMEDKLREYGLTYVKGGNISASGEVAVSPSVTAPSQIQTPPSTQFPWPINPNIRQHFTDSKPKQNGKVFIGHGHSQIWRELKDFLQDRLGLKYEEFNSESAAGTSTTGRLEAMMDNANFAFVIMTAEDERVDGTLHARENVIHEAGLFQGRLGFKRSIILKEEGCQEFSNIHGLTHISFPRNRISAAFEDIRKVLEREGVITAR